MSILFLNPVSGCLTELISSFLEYKTVSGVTIAILLAASMNFLQVGYRCGGGATSVDLPLKVTVA